MQEQDKLSGTINNIDADDFLDYEVSVWACDGDSYRPSTKFKILKKLPAGLYTIEFDRDYGVVARSLPTVSDKLLSFKNSPQEKLLKEISLFWEKKDLYKSNNLVHKRGILLMGYPGTGKTSMISIISKKISKLGGVIFFIPEARALEVYVNFLKYNFRKIEPDTPVITILEDIDKYSPIEDSLLDFLDGNFSIDHHVIIATTNNSENIPNSFLRPSRLDYVIEMVLPSREERLEFFKFKNIAKENLDRLVNLSEGFSFADLKELYVCTELLDYTIEDAITKLKTPINRKDFSKNLKSSSKIGL